MKTNVVIVVLIAILFAACTSSVPTREVAVTHEVPTEVALTQVAITQAPIVTEKPTSAATETPTEVPTETPLSCLTLLTPPDGAEIPALGKVTFSWDPMDEALFYALNIILPSGETVSFETKQTFRDQYIEAFSAGGTYQWKVIAEDRKRHEICSSEFATFSKPASNQPLPTQKDDKKKK